MAKRPPVASITAMSLPTIERRRAHRGNLHDDLCVLLESIRRRERLGALALSDSQGLLLAGAGRYSVCEELSATASRHAAQVPGAVQTFELLGQTLLVCSPTAPADPNLMHEVAHACRRIVDRRYGRIPTESRGPVRAALS